MFTLGNLDTSPGALTFDNRGSEFKKKKNNDEEEEKMIETVHLCLPSILGQIKNQQEILYVVCLLLSYH